eukprot:Clim_evm12s150 gene=Clim_evmTU12s150
MDGRKLDEAVPGGKGASQGTSSPRLSDVHNRLHESNLGPGMEHMKNVSGRGIGKENSLDEMSAGRTARARLMQSGSTTNFEDGMDTDVPPSYGALVSALAEFGLTIPSANSSILLLHQDGTLQKFRVLLETYFDEIFAQGSVSSASTGTALFEYIDGLLSQRVDKTAASAIAESMLSEIASMCRRKLRTTTVAHLCRAFRAAAAPICDKISRETLDAIGISIGERLSDENDADTFKEEMITSLFGLSEAIDTALGALVREDSEVRRICRHIDENALLPADITAEIRHAWGAEMELSNDGVINDFGTFLSFWLLFERTFETLPPTGAELLRTLISGLQELELTQLLTLPAYRKALRMDMHVYVQDTCAGEDHWMESCWPHLDSYLDISQQTVVFRQLESMLRVSEDPRLQLTLQEEMIVLRRQLHQDYVFLRADELFDIARSYPESLPAVRDLKQAIQKCELSLPSINQRIVSALSGQIRKRLLHPGIDTERIAVMYIRNIKVLRLIDPTAALVDTVCEDIRRYLRRRDDTVRCIVRMITDENAARDIFGQDDDDEGDEEDRADMQGSKDYADVNRLSINTWHKWNPLLPEALSKLKQQHFAGIPLRDRRMAHTGEMLGMLLGIYGTRENFVGEYRSLLAERLLESMDMDTDREVRSLEMLKVHLGENNMQYCDVMLKDMVESRRMRQNICSHFQRTSRECSIDVSKMSMAILSHLFWPTFRRDTMNLPVTIYRTMQVYEQGFKRQKPNRSLQFKPTVGMVELEVTLPDRQPKSFTVPVATAAILYMFQDANDEEVTAAVDEMKRAESEDNVKDGITSRTGVTAATSKPEWTTQELSQTLGLAEATVRKRIAYWTRLEILKEYAPNRFCTAERESELRRAMTIDATVGAMNEPSQSISAAEHDEDDDADDHGGALSSVRENQQEQLNLMWMFAQGMLRNLGPQSVDRLWNMVSMYVQNSDTPVHCTQADFRQFLDVKVRQDELQVSGGLYSLGD